MGWSGGTDIAIAMIKSIKTNVPNKKARRAIYKEMISALESGDWDTQVEARGVDAVFDVVLEEQQ